MERINKLKELMDAGKTVLCIGPVSKNTIDAAIKFSNDFDVIIPLIASRGQIENKLHNGGYVDNTESFAKYVLERSKNIILCRDHGGPLQGRWSNGDDFDKKEDAITDALISLEDDIANGFEILHIDTGNFAEYYGLNVDEQSDVLIEICKKCRSINPHIQFEIGSEQTSGTPKSTRDFNVLLLNYIEDMKESPLFSVIQIGNHVRDNHNEGEINIDLAIAYELDSKEHKVYTKEHNADYLQQESLILRNKLGLNALNIAPEFGYAETTFLVSELAKARMHRSILEFLNISYNSNKWVKWFSKDNEATYYKKAFVAGHYVFNDQRVKNIKEIASEKLGYDIDKEIVSHLSNKMLQYYIKLGII